MALNLNKTLLYYSLVPVESFGDCSAITVDAGYPMMEPAPLETNAEGLQFWKDYCKKKKKPYVVYSGRVKPEYVEKFHVDNKVSVIRHAIHYPKTDHVTVESLMGQTGFDYSFIMSALSRMLLCKQIERMIDPASGIESYVRLKDEKYIKVFKDKDGVEKIVDTSLSSAKLKKKPCPLEVEREVFVLMRSNSDFDWIAPL